MPYISSNGTVLEERSVFRVSILSDFFWGVINFIGVFFDTLINPSKPRVISGETQHRRYQERSGMNGTSRGAPKGSNIKGLPKGGCGPKGG